MTNRPPSSVVSGPSQPGGGVLNRHRRARQHRLLRVDDDAFKGECRALRGGIPSDAADKE